MKHTEIIAVIVSYNGLNHLLKTVNALHDKVGHIHIVDNASSDGSLEVLRDLEKKSNISIDYLSQNKGIGYALNIGVEKGFALGYNWLLTMDQDSIVSDDMVSQFCKAINNNQKLVCLTPLISVFEKDSTFNSIRNNENIVNYAITSGNLVKLSVFKTIGLYNEKLFIDCVDFDFSLRLRGAGFSIHLIPEAKLFHQLGEEHKLPKILSWVYTSHSPLRRYYMYRNWGYIFQNYFFKFPKLIIKSTIIHFLLFLIIPFYDKNPKESLRFIYYGIRDYFKNQYGPIKL